MASSIKINCTKCAKLLKVPEKAQGQKTKCPACKTIFAVPVLRAPEPDPDEAGGHSDDSIAGWILDDVDQTLDRRVEDADKKVRPPTNQTGDTVRERRLEETRKRMEQIRAGQGQRDREAQEDADDTVFLPAEALQSPGKKGAADSDDALSDAVESLQQKPAQAEKVEKKQSAKPAAEAQVTAAAPAVESPEVSAGQMVSRLGRIHVRDLNAVAGAGQSRYPQNLHVNHPVPHLVVRQCTAQGVVMAFDSVWLDHIPFRTSMPMRCVFTGSSNREEMYARPLVFIDRSSAQIRSAAEVQTGHGQRLFEDITARELLDVMGVIDKLPPPFSNPMPYYVAESVTSRYLECSTQKRPDEGITCFVNIGNPRYALDWLARVNGMCGPEYELLTEDVRRVARDPWQRLPEDLRKNLESWVRLKDGESYVDYIRDGEFTAKDAGLGGIVFTNQRMLFRKYTRHGDFDLARGGKIIISPDADFAAVSMDNGDGRIKMNALRFDDVPKLEQLLSQWPFKVEQK